jgi:hypothetical protein
MQAARLAHFKNISCYRNEGYSIIYTDKTYIQSSHTKDYAWSNSKKAGLLAPISKEQQVSTVHADSENGLISNTLLMFKSGANCGDYNSKMYFVNYEGWPKMKLNPHLLPHAAYLNVQFNLSLTPSSHRSAMIDWLPDCGIPFSEQMYMPELYSLIKLRKPQFKTFSIDALLAVHGHSVLCLPPYHPDLNLIQLM